MTTFCDFHDLRVPLGQPIVEYVIPCFIDLCGRGGGPLGSEFAEYDSFPAPRAKSFVMAGLGYLFFEDNFSEGMWKLQKRIVSVAREAHGEVLGENQHLFLSRGAKAST